jgi:hypothetical protein
MKTPLFNHRDIDNIISLYSALLEDLKSRERKETGAIYEHDGYVTYKEYLLYDKFNLSYSSHKRIVNTNPGWWRDLEEVISLVELQPIIEILKTFSDKNIIAAIPQINASITVRWSRIHKTSFEYAKTTNRLISHIYAHISILMEEATGKHRKKILMPQIVDSDNKEDNFQSDQPIPYLYRKFLTEKNLSALNEKQRNIMRDWLRTTWLETILFHLVADDFIYENEQGNEINALGNYKTSRVILFLEMIGREHLIDYICRPVGYTNKPELIINMLDSVNDGEQVRVIELLGINFLKDCFICNATNVTLRTMHGHYFLSLLELLGLSIPDRHWYPGTAYESFDLMRYPIHLRIPMIELFSGDLYTITFDAKRELTKVLGKKTRRKLFQEFAKTPLVQEDLYEKLNEQLLKKHPFDHNNSVLGLEIVLSLLPNSKQKPYLKLFEKYRNEISEIHGIPKAEPIKSKAPTSKLGLFGKELVCTEATLTTISDYRRP